MSEPLSWEDIPALMGDLAPDGPAPAFSRGPGPVRHAVRSCAVRLDEAGARGDEDAGSGQLE